MYRPMFSRLSMPFVALVVLALGLTLSFGSATAASSPGAVYTLTNQANGNSIAVFNRGADGRLTPAGTYPTGGTGTGGGLGSQGALVISNDGHWLFAVNAGSNDISVLSTSDLTTVTRIGSGGLRPISLTVFKNLLYVLNAASSNIAGFWIGANGTLTPIRGSARPLSAGNPAQIGFSTDGSVLVVTQKSSNTIDTYTVGADGLASGPTTHASNGNVPFGFAFTKHNTLLVSEAAGGTLSSYRVGTDGSVGLVAGSVSAPGQNAACWAIVTKNGKFAYVTNAASKSITGYRIANDGTIKLLNPSGVTALTDASPIDMALSHNSQFLYVLANGDHKINAFAVQSDGSLVTLPGAGGLPVGAVGLAAW